MGIAVPGTRHPEKTEPCPKGQSPAENEAYFNIRNKKAALYIKMSFDEFMYTLPSGIFMHALL